MNIAENVIRSMTDPELFERFFQPASSWSRWLTVLRCLFGLPLSEEELSLFRRCTGRKTPFAEPLTEAWLACGRRSGKSRTLALIAACLACFRDYTPYLSPGEYGVVFVLATDRDQAQVIFQYLRALIMETPMLRAMVVNETADTIELVGRVAIEVRASNYKSVRGRTLIAALCDEIAFWRSEDSRNPAAAVLTALRPAMATIPGAMLLCASSTYAMEGPLYDAFVRHHGRDTSSVLVWRADTLTMNPSFRKSVIEKAYEEDALDAAAEYGSEFRTGLTAFLEEDWIQASLDTGCFERTPAGRFRYYGFVDPSGGKRDSFTLGIAHRQGEIGFLDVAREWRAPLDPKIVVAEIAEILPAYGITSVTGDAYAGEWVASSFREHNIRYTASELNKSEIYLEAGPHMAAGRVRLLDSQRLTGQLRQLERKTTQGGRDRVDHPRGGMDDLANGAMGAIRMALTQSVHRLPPRGARPELAIM